jgi:cytochrome c553
MAVEPSSRRTKGPAPATESFALSVASGKGLAKLRKEAKKCVLVCANCHGEIESGLLASPPPGATYAAA